MNYKNIAFAIMALGVVYFLRGSFDYLSYLGSNHQYEFDGAMHWTDRDEALLVSAMLKFAIGAKVLFGGLLLGAIASLKEK